MSIGKYCVHCFSIGHSLVECPRSTCPMNGCTATLTNTHVMLMIYSTHLGKPYTFWSVRNHYALTWCWFWPGLLHGNFLMDQIQHLFSGVLLSAVILFVPCVKILSVNHPLFLDVLLMYTSAMSLMVIVNFFILCMY